jgi:hypothetical protein
MNATASRLGWRIQTFTRVSWTAASLCLAVCFSTSAAKASLLYSNAKPGSPESVGLVLGNAQLVGMRFQLSSSAIIDGIGGNIQVLNTVGNESIFGTLVRLTDMSDYPDSIDLSTPDVLATITFGANAGFTDLTIPIAPLTVQPGDYALVFGSGLFGATGIGSMSTDNPNFADSSTFYYNTADDNWGEYGAAGGLRFTIYGTSVPEPSSASLTVCLAVILSLRCRFWRV